MRVSHLLFVDDTLVFVMLTKHNCSSETSVDLVSGSVRGRDQPQKMRNYPSEQG